jgi:hypothetical protein
VERVNRLSKARALGHERRFGRQPERALARLGLATPCGWGKRADPDRLVKDADRADGELVADPHADHDPLPLGQSFSTAVVVGTAVRFDLQRRVHPGVGCEAPLGASRTYSSAKGTSLACLASVSAAIAQASAAVRASPVRAARSRRNCSHPRNASLWGYTLIGNNILKTLLNALVRGK